MNMDIFSEYVQGYIRIH
jgi:hypothetical protein